MAGHSDIPGVAMQLSRGVVVASIQVDLDAEVLVRFREDLLRRIHESGSQGVILDVSGLDMLDSVEFMALRRIMDMTRLLGAEAVLVGLRPGVVSALIQTGAEVEGLQAAIDLDAGFALLQPQPVEPEPEVSDAAESESQPEGEGEAGLEGASSPEAQA